MGSDFLVIISIIHFINCVFLKCAIETCQLQCHALALLEMAKAEGVEVRKMNKQLTHLTL